MSLGSKIFGARFTELFAHGEEIEDAIASNGEALLKKSTPGLEDYFSLNRGPLPPQNALPASMVILLLCISFSFVLIFFLQLAQVSSPPRYVALFFIPSILFLLTVLASSWFLARGRLAGLRVWKISYGVLVAICSLEMLFCLVEMRSALWVAWGISAFCLMLTRLLLNSRAFALFVLYCRSRRLASEARKTRMRSSVKGR